MPEIDTSIIKVLPLEKSALSKRDKERSAVPDLVDDFSGLLKNELGKVNDVIVDAEKMAQKLVSGEVKDVHEVMIAAQKADLALQFTMQIRSQIMQAYQEIMRMR